MYRLGSSLPVSLEAILLNALDARRLLTEAVNTSLQTPNRSANLIDEQGL